MINFRVKEHIFIIQEKDMMDNYFIPKNMAWVLIIITMVTNMKANGKMIKNKAKEFTNMIIMKDMKVIYKIFNIE